MASGCVPLLFDGGDGSPLYSKHVPTYWPWRASPAALPLPAGSVGLDYGSFAVVVNATDAIAGADFLGPLMAMPSAQVAALQQGVDAAAPAMVYAPAFSGARPNDAFARFESIVRAITPVPQRIPMRAP